MPNLNALIRGLTSDPGLKANNPQKQIERGVNAAKNLDAVLLKAINDTNVNDDRRISAADMGKISEEVFNNPASWQKFILSHGNDAGRTTGYHWIQNDGATLVFQGRNFVDTVADAIYHFGFEIRNGRYFNEDGNDNETAVDVAGWLNFFLNGENIVYGSAKADMLYSGEYSNYFRAARNETFIGGDGADSIGGDVGNDRIYGGTGNDQAGGDNGNDRLFGEAGKDQLWGGDGGDKIFGGGGDDVLGGGRNGDYMDGGDDNDILYGEDGGDRLYGGAGRDELSGGSGNDGLFGGAWSDQLSGGNGADRLTGGKGADEINLWEDSKAADTIIFREGDCGNSRAEADLINGFQRGSDKIVLAGFDDIKLMAGDDFRGGGKASCRFINDGEDSRLVIDVNGDAATDMTIYMPWLDGLGQKDFIFS